MNQPTRVRTAKYRAKLIATGLKPVSVFVPVDRVPELRAFAEKLRSEAKQNSAKAISAVTD